MGVLHGFGTHGAGRPIFTVEVTLPVREHLCGLLGWPAEVRVMPGRAATTT